MKPDKAKKPKAPAGAVPIEPQQLRAVMEGRDQALSIKEMKQRLGCRGDTTVYELTRKGVLPRPVKLGGSTRWLLSQIGAAA